MCIILISVQVPASCRYETTFCILDGAFLDSGWATGFTAVTRLPTGGKDKFMVRKMHP